MAGEMAQFFVRLGTVFDDKGFKDAAAGVKGIESRVDALSGVMRQLGAAVGAGSAIYGIVTFAKSAVDAFAEEERSANRLRGAMQSLGSYSKAAFDDQLAFAESLAKTSTYTHEEINEVQTLLTTYGLYGDKLKQTTQAVADLAARKGLDLHTATVMLGKAFDGETGRLALLGIHFQDTGSRARNFSDIMAEVQRVAGGAASAELNTYAGQVKNLGNRFGELKEQIGRELMPVASLYVGWLKTAADAMERLAEGATKDKRGRELTIDAMSREIGSTQELILLMQDSGIKRTADGQTVEDLRTRLGKLTAARESEISALKRENALKSTPPPPVPKASRDDITDAGRIRMQEVAKHRIEEDALQQSLANQADLYGAVDADRAMFEANTLASRLMTQAAFEDNVLKKHKLTAAAENVLDKAKNQTAMQGTAAALGFIQGAWGEHTAMYKATSLALATINTMQAYTAALAIPIWGLNYICAGLVLASGMAMVAKIAGVQLAKGGLAMARPGGVMAQIAEGGQDEAVLPLDGRTMSRLASAIVRSLSMDNMNQWASTIGRASLGAGASMARLTPATAVAGGSVHFNQVNHFGNIGGQGSGGAGLSDLLNDIRTATRDGMAEALDMAKQIVRTGDSLDNEA